MNDLQTQPTHCPACGVKLMPGSFMCPPCARKAQRATAVQPSPDPVAEFLKTPIGMTVGVCGFMLVVTGLWAYSRVRTPAATNPPRIEAAIASTSPATIQGNAKAQQLADEAVSRATGAADKADDAARKEAFSFHWEGDYIVGHLKNLTGQTQRYVQVTFGLYDAEGAKIGTAFDNMTELKAGEVWKFKAYTWGKQGAVTCRLDKISGL